MRENETMADQTALSPASRSKLAAASRDSARGCTTGSPPSTTKRSACCTSSTPLLPGRRRALKHCNPHPARYSEQSFVSRRSSTALHHARHHNGVLRRNAHPLRLRQLPRPADDRRARHGLPAAERIQLLDHRLRRLAALFSFFGGFGLSGMGSAPDVGWWAYAPLTARAFSPGHNTDYWALALSSAASALGTAINIVSTVISMRCPGMTLFRMPLFVWLILVVSGLISITISPLTAAQIMLISTATSAVISSIPRPAARPSCGCTSSGSSAIPRSMSWCFPPSPSPTKLFRSSRAKPSSAIQPWSRPRSASASSASAFGRTTCSRLA